MFPVGENNSFSEKKTDFGATAAINQQRRLYQIWGGTALIVMGDMGLHCCDVDYEYDVEQWWRKSLGIQRWWKR